MLVAIHQPNYLPWCGYFAKLAAADCFVILDDVALPRGRSYVSRTQVLGMGQTQWMSIPLQRTLSSSIGHVQFADSRWPARHARTLQERYGRSPFGSAVLPPILALYDDPGEYLATFNLRLLRAVVALLDIDTRLVQASELGRPGHGSQHLADLVAAVGGTAYLSGPSGKKYLDESLFTRMGIPIYYGAYMTRPYPQRQPSFVPGLSILDALCHIGPEGTRRLLDYPGSPGRSQRPQA